MEPGGILEKGLNIDCRKTGTQRMSIEEGKVLQHTKGQGYKLPLT